MSPETNKVPRSNNLSEGASHLMPKVECPISKKAMIRSSQEMPTAAEQIVDSGMNRLESLGLRS